LTTASCSGSCPIGFYCPVGGTQNATQYPCPTGYYGDSFGISNPLCSGLCSAGYFCPPASSSPTAVPCGSIAVYCGVGSTNPTPVSGGYYSIGSINHATRTGQASCLTGYYCVGGEAFVCGNDGFYCPPFADKPIAVTFGYYSVGGSSNLTRTGQQICPSGYFCIGGNLFECGSAAVYCPMGSVQPISADAGYYTGGGISALTRTQQSPCEAGYYCSNGIRRPCGDVSLYCPPLSFQPIPVSPGYYSIGGNSTVTRTSQTICTSGQYCINGQQLNCGDSSLYCPPGSVQPSVVAVGFYSGNGSSSQNYQSQYPCPAGSSCLAGVQSPCPPGSYASLSRLTQCTLCPPGTSALKPGSTTCTDCGYGFYQPFIGQSECLTCPIGSFTSLSNSATCAFCEPGQILLESNNTHQQTSCTSCLSGTYSYNNTCSSCQPTTYASHEGSSTCSQCPDGTFSSKYQSTNCWSCNHVYGVTCKQGQITNEDNVWMAIHENDGQVTTLACLPEHCISNQQCSPFRKPFHENVLCGECQDEYTEWNGSCVKCDGVNGGFVFIIIVISWIYVLFTHYLSNGPRKRSGATTTFFYFVQICYLETGTITGWLSWITFFNFAPHQSSGSTCVLPLTPYQLFALNTFIPFLFLIQLYITMLIHYCLVKYQYDCFKAFITCRWNGPGCRSPAKACFRYCCHQVFMKVVCTSCTESLFPM
jgi:hypothetical protein